MKRRHEAAVHAFLFSLAGTKTSGHLRAELNRAVLYGSPDEKWIAAIRAEAAELIDLLYGEADPMTLARPGLPKGKRK